MKSWLINLFLIVSLIGVLDAAYLTWSHFQGAETGCFLVDGCDVVLRSEYSELFKIPTAVLGLFYYLVIFFGVFLYNLNKSTLFLKRIALFTVVGFIASLWFLYLQAFVIKAFCTYCLVSAVTSITLFLLGIYILRKIVASGEQKMIESKDLI